MAADKARTTKPTSGHARPLALAVTHDQRLVGRRQSRALQNKMADDEENAKTQSQQQRQHQQQEQEAAARASLKRRRTSSSTENPDPRRSLKQHAKQHCLKHVQAMPPATEPAPQDAIFAPSQLLRSIAAALTIAGYDSVRPSALESFRALVDEYMLSFLSDVRTSMLSSRRTTPIPSDFTYALSSHISSDVGAGASSLEPHLALPIPASLASCRIEPPKEAEPEPLDLAPMLGRELVAPAIASSYIPSHFPPLPSRHTYTATKTYTSREANARKIRERATEEGVLAEQALRRLTSARARDLAAQRSARGGGEGERGRARERSWRDVVGELVLDDDDDNGDEQVDGQDGFVGMGESAFSFDGAGDEKKSTQRERERGDKDERTEALMRSGGLGVNHDRTYWRRGVGAAVR